MADSESDLVERARGGDRQALAELVIPYREAIANTVHASLSPELRGRLDIDDLVQETILRAMLAVDDLEWRGPIEFRRWTLTIAENVAREAHRRHAGAQCRDVRREVCPEEVSDHRADDVGPVRRLRREERFTRLSHAFRNLSRDHRHVITLARIQGLPLAKVGQRMGRSPEATSALLLRALRELRRHLDRTDSLRLPPRALESGTESTGP